MSILALFAIGTVVFAVTVYGSVMAGSLFLMRESEKEDVLPTAALRPVGPQLSGDDN